MGSLTALGVRNAKPGRHADGDGLHLLVKPSGARSWMLRIQVDGKRRDIGLGSVANVSLAEAREKAADYRRDFRRGVDPTIKREAPAAIPTFQKAAEDCHAEMKGAWRNPKHAKQWLSTLETYANPKIGSQPVDVVDGPMIRDLLSPIWLTIPETAKRVHQRIGMVLDYAMAKGWRQQETPSRSVLRGLPKQRLIDRHFAAMPFVDLPAYMDELRAQPETVGRMALMFTILTAARSGEVRGAVWSEIDLAEKLWRVPGERMKGHREHLVPLTDAAIDILERMKPLKDVGDVTDAERPERPIFPGKKGQPLSDMTLSKILRDGGKPFTVHGFRSSFRDWAAEETETASEVVEKALAHTIPNKVEAAYRRTDFLQKRRKLMEKWAEYVSTKAANEAQADK